MLRLENIQKTYGGGEAERVEALRGVSLSFRKSEFVAILGPSGCGKTTLLNIIGGLDRYSSGSLSIAGVSTETYQERDWDAYRNHSVGFVFQTYNLIPHQSVLANVELALTLSGVGKAERQRRAAQALRDVGLGDQLRKKPNQMSGGQMQRVAIARALVTDPEIVLADEPTGALDSETSVQVMELLREVARDRLVIMVTHNPELAEKYATRTIRLLDGRVVDDSNPYSDAEEQAEPRQAGKPTGALPSMRSKTAFGLSLNNLLTKKARTLMVAFAGSIGIIGIALILSLSTGVQGYIDDIESEALTSYPISIQSTAVDASGVMGAMVSLGEEAMEPAEPGMIGTNTMMSQMYNTMRAEAKHNDLASFKAYLDAQPEIDKLTSAVQYEYTGAFTAFNTTDASAVSQVYPNTVFSSMMGSFGAQMSAFSQSGIGSMSAASSEFWAELPGESAASWETQYELVAGQWPQSETDVVLMVDRTYRLSDISLYAQGIKDQSTLTAQFADMMRGSAADSEALRFSYETLFSLSFTAIAPGDLYLYNEQTGLYDAIGADSEQIAQALARGVELRVCGIVKGATSSISSTPSGSILYTPALTRRFLNAGDSTQLYAAQLASPEIDVRTGLLFSDASDETFFARFSEDSLTDSQRRLLAMQSERLYTASARRYSADLFSEETGAQALARARGALESTPDSISIYPVNFEAKDGVIALIEAYNAAAKAEGREEQALQYTDYVGILMSSVSTIVNAVTSALIAFVAISLVVSSIMIGVITYISVLERTKEIGILRAIGASKRDISRVFNAETLIVGLAAGALGVGVAWLITIPANSIVYNLSGIERIARLPALAACALALVSMALTLIAGIIPSRIAAKRDPVVALRSE